MLPQESSSESINSYYALGLLGQALQDPAMESLGRALMTLEIQGTKSYWHSTKLETVYPEVYAENKVHAKHRFPYALARAPRHAHAGACVRTGRRGSTSSTQFLMIVFCVR